MQYLKFIAKSTCILLTTATIAEAFSPASAASSSITSASAIAGGSLQKILDSNGESCSSSQLSKKCHRLPLHLHMSTTAADIFHESPQSNEEKSEHNAMSNAHSNRNSDSDSDTTRGTMAANYNKKKNTKKKGRIGIDFEPKNSSPALSCIEIFPISQNKDLPTKNKKRSNSSNGNRNVSTQINRKRRGIASAPTASSSQSTRLLTREEESTLTQSIQKLKSVMQSGNEVSYQNTSPNLLPYLPAITIPSKPSSLQTPSEQEWATACHMSIQQLRLTLLQGKESRARLVSANMGLVLTIAKRYDYELKKSVQGGGGNGVGTILTLSDLVQEGNMGLMEAAERFDVEKGARFATYAGYWVKQRILRAITENSRVIRLPAHVHSTLRTIRKGKSDVQKLIGREPTLSELAHHLNIPIDKIRLYNDSSRSVISLNSPLSGAGGGSSSSSKSGSGDMDRRTLGDKIAFDGPTPEEDAEMESLKREIRNVIDGLGNVKERDVLFYRFGLEDGEPCTLEETGRRLGISRERVRVIENRALNKLRHPQRNYRLKEYVEEGRRHGLHGGQHQGKDAVIDLYGEKRIDFMANSEIGSDIEKKIATERDGDALSMQRPEQIWSF